MNIKRYPKRVVQINTFDIGGGAEKYAKEFYLRIQNKGIDSWLVVGSKKGNGDRILPVENHLYRSMINRYLMKLTGWLENRQWKIFNWKISGLPRRIANLDHWVLYWLGKEDFNYPGTMKFVKSIPGQIDILHMHNLHGGYFDLRALPALSKVYPVVMTLHDEWLLTGHCACTMGCSRWRMGCGNCPNLDIYPKVRIDNTANNLLLKKNIYAHSHLYITTPSQWLMDKVQDSILAQSIRQARVIPNGVDLNVFRVADRCKVRNELGIPQNAIVLAYVVKDYKTNRFKDYPAIMKIIDHLGQNIDGRSVILLALGADQGIERNGTVEIRRLAYTPDPQYVSNVYQAANVYVHMAHADNFPTTVIEALSCGIPVVASNVGGIPEQIREGENGYLIPTGEIDLAVKRISDIINIPNLSERMSLFAQEDAKRRFNIDQQINSLIEFYSDAMDDHLRWIS